MFLDEVQADLTRYECLPLNAWERIELINTVLTPRWTYRAMLIPDDKIFKKVDQLSKEFVTKCKGVVAVRHATKNSAPVKAGGVGLCQMF